MTSIWSSSWLLRDSERATCQKGFSDNRPVTLRSRFRICLLWGSELNPIFQLYWIAFGRVSDIEVLFVGISQVFLPPEVGVWGLKRHYCWNWILHHLEVSWMHLTGMLLSTRWHDWRNGQRVDKCLLLSRLLEACSAELFFGAYIRFGFAACSFSTNGAYTSSHCRSMWLCASSQGRGSVVARG